MKHLLDTKEQTGLSLARQCRQSDVAYSSFMRWRRRSRLDLPPVMQPGPGPVEPVDWGRLFEDIMHLHHCQERTHGVAALKEKYGRGISNRDFDALVAWGRAVHAQEKADATIHVEWKCPRLVWSMDTTEAADPVTGEKICIQTVQDVSTCYKFETLAGANPRGKAIAGLLDALFSRHGAPLFLKRDNGSNQCHCAVDAVLARHGVIPLDSPPDCARYNGGVEHAQYEIQQALIDRLQTAPAPARWLHIGAYASNAMHDLNHRARRRLQWKNACAVFNSGVRHAMINMRQRKEVTDEIIQTTVRWLDVIADITLAGAHRAWRLAVETWLVAHDAISLSKERVLPDFPAPKLS